MINTHTQDAKRIIRETTYALKHLPVRALPHVAKGFASSYGIPQKVMLKAMSRYIRIQRAN
jgi:hypothetical protein